MCKKPHRINIPYEELFSDENCERLKEAAEKIIKTIESMERKGEPPPPPPPPKKKKKP